MALSLTTTAPGKSADYMKYLSAKPVKTDRNGEPTLLDFALAPSDASFVKLTRGNYITLATNTYGKWFTGFITNDPELEYLGTNNNVGVWAYKYQATSDELIINAKPIGLVQPYTNTDMGTILKSLASLLYPGFFDVTNVSAGQKIARYIVDPTQHFSDVVKEFCDAAQFRFWARDKKLNFIQQDSVVAGISINGTDKHFSPDRLTIKPSASPIYNDVIVVGNVEPQEYMNEYFVGDSLTGTFPMLANVFGVDSTILLNGDFSSAIDTNVWSVFDTATNFFQTFNGYLNVLGGKATGTDLSVYVQSNNLMPLEGALRMTHGEFDFVNSGTNNTMQGVIGGLFTGAPTTSDAVNFTGCIFGIRAFRDSGGVLRLAHIINGVYDSTQLVVIDYTKRYILRTIMSQSSVYRYFTDYSYVDSAGVVHHLTQPNQTQSVTFTTLIVEIDPSNGNVTNNFTLSNVTSLTGSQTFAFYVPVATNNLHCTIGNITISTPMQASLQIKPSGGSAYLDRLIGANDIDAMDGTAPYATITDANNGVSTISSFFGTPQYNSGQASLTFFKDSTKQTSTTPQIGDIVHLAYRRAGISVADVRSASSVATESAAWGDNGIRSWFRNDVSPQPRNSQECELAAASLLSDNSYQHYEGSYQQWSDFVTSEPQAGQILQFTNLPASFPSVTAEEITEVVTEFSSSKPIERFNHTVSFGKVDKLNRVLGDIYDQTNQPYTLPTDTAQIPDYINPGAVGNAFAPDVVAPTLVSQSATQLNFNTNQAPPTGGGFEVRYEDAGWGCDDGKNLIVRTTGSTQTFSVPRNKRGQVCFVKAYDIRNLLLRAEDLSNASWSKGTGTTVAAPLSGANADGDMSQISSVVFASGSTNGIVFQTISTVASGKQAVFTASVKGTAGKTIIMRLSDSAGTTLANSTVTLTGAWQRVSVSGTYGVNANTIRVAIVNNEASTQTVSVTQCSIEVGTLVETVYCKTVTTAYGAVSRFAAGLRVVFPFVPPTPTGTLDTTDPTNVVITPTLPTNAQDVWGVEIRATDNSTVLYKADLVSPNYKPAVTLANSSRSLSFYVYFYNLLGEYSPALNLTATYTAPTITGLTVDESVIAVRWGFTGNPISYKVEIDNVDATFTHLVVNTSVPGTFFLLSDPDFFQQRSIRITPSDKLGAGTASTTSHVYTPAAVVELTVEEVQSVPGPITPTTDPPSPTRAAFTPYIQDWVAASWALYAQNNVRTR